MLNLSVLLSAVLSTALDSLTRDNQIKFFFPDIDECKSKNNTCDAIEHSYCFNVEKFLPSDDGYHCLCETGYRQVGRSCVAEGQRTSITITCAHSILGITLLQNDWARGFSQRSCQATRNDVSMT